MYSSIHTYPVLRSCVFFSFSLVESDLESTRSFLSLWSSIYQTICTILSVAQTGCKFLFKRQDQVGMKTLSLEIERERTVTSERDSYSNSQTDTGICKFIETPKVVVGSSLWYKQLIHSSTSFSLFSHAMEQRRKKLSWKELRKEWEQQQRKLADEEQPTLIERCEKAFLHWVQRNIPGSFYCLLFGHDVHRTLLCMDSFCGTSKLHEVSLVAFALLFIQTDGIHSFLRVSQFHLFHLFIWIRQQAKGFVHISSFSSFQFD